MPSYLPYAEPSAVQLLTVTSFLYFLNVSRYIFDKVLYTGLIGEIALGVVYGTPLAGILEVGWQEAFTVLGYVGLVLIVFEGGLDIQPALLVQNLPLSTLAALTGIGLPIASSMLLLHVCFGYPLIHAFTAGAALSSTSLGTTFFVLQSQKRSDSQTVGRGKDWSQTRVGTVLLSAALMDDIVGLILLSVVTSIGEETGSGSGAIGWNVGRPLLASSLLTIVVPPLWTITARPAYEGITPRLSRFSRATQEHVVLVIAIAVLSGLVAAAYFAGSSMLLGAFLAGIVLQTSPNQSPASNIRTVYDAQLGQLKEKLLVPLFFASIGFAIPFLQLWTGRVVWRGLCYALLMAIAKFVVGGWILMWDPLVRGLLRLWSGLSQRIYTSLRPVGAGCEPRQQVPRADQAIELPLAHDPNPVHEQAQDPEAIPPKQANGAVPAAALLGLALVARGEIGILIAQVAHSTGTGADAILPDEPFLLAIWATILCTIVGPVAVGWVAPRYQERIYASRWG